MNATFRYLTKAVNTLWFSAYFVTVRIFKFGYLFSKKVGADSSAE
jgi:hypothetical protein